MHLFNEVHEKGLFQHVEVLDKLTWINCIFRTGVADIDSIWEEPASNLMSSELPQDKYVMILPSIQQYPSTNRWR
jgi:hypothetical protein